MHPAAETWLVLALLALLLWTYGIALALGRGRTRAVKQGQVAPKGYKLMNAQEPEILVKLARNYGNLFESPVAFYVVGLAVLHMGLADMVYVGLAWGFVGLRVLHSWIHLTYNHVLHRFLAFATALLVVMVMTLRLVVQLLV
ncbi:MAG: MAPEG family protein [Sphingomonadales bacterium]